MQTAREVVELVIKPLVKDSEYLPFTAYNELCVGAEGTGKLHVAYLNEHYLKGLASRSTWEKALKDAGINKNLKRMDRVGKTISKEDFIAAYELRGESNFRRYLKLAREAGADLSLQDIAKYLNILEHHEITDDQIESLSAQGHPQFI